MHVEKYVHPSARFYDSISPPARVAPREPRPSSTKACASRSSSPLTPRKPTPLPAPQGGAAVRTPPPPARARAAATRASCSTSSSTAPTSPRASARRTARSSCGTSRSRSPTSARRPRGKASVRFYDEPWEVMRRALRRHRVPQRVPRRPGAARRRLRPRRALPRGRHRRARRHRAPPPRAPAASRPRRASSSARPSTQLRTIDLAPADDGIRVPEPVLVVVEPERDAPLAFGAEFAMRERAPGAGAGTAGGDDAARPSSARTSTRCSSAGACAPRSAVAPSTSANATRSSSPSASSSSHAAPSTRGSAACPSTLAARPRASSSACASPPTASSRSPSAARRATPAARCTPSPRSGSPTSSRRPSPSGASLVRAILRRDRSQGQNLRLAALRRALRDGTDALREASQTDSKVNPTPGALSRLRGRDATRRAPRQSPSTFPAARLRYAARWRAIVPGIDLRATYLCGDRLVVGAATEMWGLDRATGRVLWRVDVDRGTSVVTPGGIARLAPDGTLSVHDFGNGEVTLRARLAPRVGGPVAGAVVHLPGLPQLVVVTEGEHHLVAVDLTSGEPRWRWSWGNPNARAREGRAAPRLKRAGRLLYVTCGDSALTALDVIDRRRRLAPARPPALPHARRPSPTTRSSSSPAAPTASRASTASIRSRATSAGPASSPSRAHPAPSRALPSPPQDAVAVAGAPEDRAHASPPSTATTARPCPGARRVRRAERHLVARGRRRLHRQHAERGARRRPTAGRRGELRWRHVLGPRPLEADVPRRLEPVLRCGALFVPHADVARPPPARRGPPRHDPAPAEAIPDLLRVDERCDVYVAEESGHLVCFGALPRLSLV